MYVCMYVCRYACLSVCMCELYMCLEGGSERENKHGLTDVKRYVILCYMMIFIIYTVYTTCIHTHTHTRTHTQTSTARISKLFFFFTFICYLLLQFLSDFNKIFCAYSSHIEVDFKGRKLFYVYWEGLSDLSFFLFFGKILRQYENIAIAN